MLDVKKLLHKYVTETPYNSIVPSLYIQARDGDKEAIRAILKIMKVRRC